MGDDVGSHGIHAGGGLTRAAWVLFFDYLPALPADSYVCVNNIAHLIGGGNVQRTLRKAGITYRMSKRAYGVASDFLRVAVRSLDGADEEVVGVFIWPGGDATPTQRLCLIRPWDLQMHLLAKTTYLRDEFVRLTNEAVKYSGEDIVCLACNVTGIMCDGDGETVL